MDEERAKILAQAEGQWKVILTHCPASLQTKKDLRDQFNLQLNEISEWMTPGNILQSECKFDEASELKNKLAKISIQTELIQTGINYRDNISTEEIVNTLTAGSVTISDYIIYTSGGFGTKDMYLLIENNDLSTACLKLLLSLEILSLI